MKQVIERHPKSSQKSSINNNPHKSHIPEYAQQYKKEWLYIRGINSNNNFTEYVSQFRKEWLTIKDYDNLSLTIKIKEYIECLIYTDKNIVYDYLLSLVNFINKYFVNPSKCNLKIVDWYFIDLIINKDRIMIRGIFYELGLFIEDNVLTECFLELESRINEIES